MNSKGLKGLHEMQLGAWVVFQLQGIVSNQGLKKTVYYMSMSLLIQTMSVVLTSWIDEQFLS